MVTNAIMSGLPELKEYRRENSLSRAKFGAQVGVDRATVFRWETGQRRIDKDKVPKVSEVTGLPREVLRPDLAAIFSEAAE